MLEARKNTGMAAPYTITTASCNNNDNDAFPDDIDNCPNNCNTQCLMLMMTEQVMSAMIPRAAETAESLCVRQNAKLTN